MTNLEIKEIEDEINDNFKINEKYINRIEYTKIKDTDYILDISRKPYLERKLLSEPTIKITVPTENEFTECLWVQIDNFIISIKLYENDIETKYQIKMKILFAEKYLHYKRSVEWYFNSKGIDRLMKSIMESKEEKGRSYSLNGNGYKIAYYSYEVLK